MSNFGELVLVVGDFHIPTRATKIPAPFKRMLVPNKMQHIICTGNLSSDTYEELRALAPNLHVAKGDWDMNTSFPETRVVQVGGFRIGVVHGHQVLPHSTDALSILRRKLNVDILVSGHTHQSDVTIHEDQYYFINPGSITGAYSSTTASVIPSFILLAVQGNKATCYVYELNNDEVEVTKTEFTKKENASGSNSTLLNSLLA